MIQTSINKKGEPLEKRKILNIKKILNLSHINTTEIRSNPKTGLYYKRYLI